MIFLALDTSTERAAIGVESRSGEIFSASIETTRRHGRDLIPRLKATLEAACLKLPDVKVFAVGVGPGSYTGLRVGIMAAKTLAYATGASLVGFDSLAAIARNAPADARRISVIADAQRGNLYVADYLREATGPPRCTRATQIEPLVAWLARLEPETLVIGPALDAPRIRAALPHALNIAPPALNFPDGHRLIEQARELWDDGRRDDLWQLEPRYLRQSSAEELWNSRNPHRSD
jgi:tRNA threonylcarbamoyladenosine biosynthesis protein TsaB